MKSTQPDNEQIIKEISEAEQYLKGLLERLLKLNATPRSLSDIVQALEIVSRSYVTESQCGGALIGRGMAIGGAVSATATELRLPDSVIEQITKAIKEAIANGINA